MRLRLLISCLMIPLMVGCATTGTPNPGKPDWDKMAPTIQSRVRYVAAFAFSMKQVRPHKEQICTIAAQIGDMLDSYNDKNASFETVRAAVMNMVNQISDPNVRQAVIIFVDMVLTETFNYAWHHYEDFINRDEVKTTILVALAVGNGLREACEMVVSSMNAGQGQYVYNVFTIPIE